MAFSDFFTKASQEKDPFKRMLNMAAFNAATQWFVINRTSKPFISLLGETFEVVTEKFKYYGENVSQQPPLLAFCAEGKGFKILNNSCTRMKFTGSAVNVENEGFSNVQIFHDENAAPEEYSL